ncbi:MAG: hypothetical protein EPN17_04890 [Methylobacter sp.]|nr:MAG: hypothetical protein EPN17_04890 [Methylobacter sp.]
MFNGLEMVGYYHLAKKGILKKASPLTKENWSTFYNRKKSLLQSLMKSESEITLIPWGVYAKNDRIDAQMIRHYVRSVR